VSEPSEALKIALDRHRDRNARYIGVIRVAGGALWFATNSLISYFTPTRHESVAQQPYVLGYLAVGIIALVLLRSSAWVRQRAHALQWLVDMPGIFLVMWVGVNHAQNPVAIAYLTGIIFALLITVGQLTARPLDAPAEALVATVLFVLLMIHAGNHPSAATGPGVVMLLIAAVAHYASRQMRGALDEVTRTEAMRERLSRYLSPSVRDAVMAAGVSSVSTRREVTVLMSDLRGFTSLAEKMDSEKLARDLNEYFKAMVEVVFKHKGTLDKFIGDGMLVYFGAPLPNEKHASTAVQCALEMQTALETLNQTRAARGDAPLRMGIGINCGQVVCGDLGPPERVEYTIIGDTVNVTARMESLTKKFGVKVLASEEVQKRAAGVATFAPMKPTEVAGKAEPLLTWAVEPA
jgi:adenylate cyclase